MSRIKKNPEPHNGSGLNIFRRRPTLPHSFPCSTIGAEGLNFRVRDGNGCFPLAIATENLISSAFSSVNLDLNYRYLLTDLCRLFCGQAARPISTGKLNALLRLHTRPINLVVFKGSSGNIRCGISNLEVGFPLRCFQRLSFPNLATQPCRWRDNWNTIGSSIPVLSY
jgi:hypothetical protein